MPSGPDVRNLAAEAEALIAEVALGIERTQEFFETHEFEAGLVLQERISQREEFLRQYVLERVGQATQCPARGAPSVEPDPATVFARRIYRRREIV